VGILPPLEGCRKFFPRAVIRGEESKERIPGDQLLVLSDMCAHARKHNRLDKACTFQPVDETASEGGNATFNEGSTLLKYNQFVARTFVKFQRHTQVATTAIRSRDGQDRIRINGSDLANAFLVVEIVEQEIDGELSDLSDGYCGHDESMFGPVLCAKCGGLHNETVLHRHGVVDVVDVVPT